MEKARHEFRLGKLIVTGDKYDFLAEPALKFTAKPGDIAGIYLHYRYAEASKEKETLDLKFKVTLDGKDLGTRTTKVEDSRMFKDEQWGILKHELPLDTKGLLTGAFTVEALYTKGAWSGKGPNKQTPFRKSGDFTITVR